MVHISINGQHHAVAHGRTILDALRAAHVDVPHLCHDDRLAPAAVCRLCLVEVEGDARHVPACATPVSEGMAVWTHTPALEAQRRATLALLASRCPDAGDLTPFGRALRAYGLERDLRGVRDPDRVDESNPYLRADMSRCILCYRCVRICGELQGQFAWMVLNRGQETRIVPDSGTTLWESSCVTCGACVDTCPTGALEDAAARRLGAPSAWTRTVCPYCGVGCEVDAGTRDGRLVSIRPAAGSRVSKGHLCSKGRYAFEFVHSADRVTTPMIREGGRWRTVGWDDAVRHVADRLRAIVERHGPESVGVLGSARATNEENYVAQKFARVVLGTHNVDCCARVCHAPTAAALKATLGTGVATGSYDDIEQARTLLVCGADATEGLPVLGARIKQATLRGAHLVVVDPRRIELARHAAIHVQLRPGTNVPLFNAMAHVIVAEGLVDEPFVRERVADLGVFRSSITQWTPERAAAICGVGPEVVRQAARLYARERPSLSVHGLGVTEHVQGTDGVMSLVNLALLTGNVGRPGAGVIPLRGQNNVQGAAHMGCEPANLTGYVPIGEARPRFETVWKARLPSTAGLDLPRMLEAAGAGRLHGLWVIGYDVLLTNPDARRTREALGSLDLLVVQDLFMNETARELGTVFLPAAGSFEKDGTFMNAERRVQRVRRAVPPPGAAMSDWEIVCAVARAMGHAEGFGFRSAEEIWNEIRSLWKPGAGITYARLEEGGIQWPCPSEDHPGTRTLHEEEFAVGKRAALKVVDFRPSPEAVSDEYPFLLITGRTLHQFNSGTMTQRTPHALLRPRDVLAISPADAQEFGLAQDDLVEIRSHYGEAVLPVRVDPGMRPRELFATFHTAAAFVNAVTGPHRDAQVDTPEYKVTAVRIGKIPRSAEVRPAGA